METHTTATDQLAERASSDTTTARRPDLPRGASLRDLEEAGVSVVPVYHDTKACAADVLGIGRSLAYDMAASGRLPVIELGKRRVCSVAQLRAMLSA